MSEADSGRMPQEPQIGEPKSLVEVINKHVVPRIGKYAAVLHAEAEDSKYSELGSYSQEQFLKHLKELDGLRRLLSDVNNGKPFDIVAQHHKLLQRHDNSRDTFSLGLAPKGEKPPIGSEQMQNQLRFHVSVDAAGEESPTQAIYALSVTGNSPDRVLQNYFRQSRAQQVIVNTVGAYIDPDSENIRINPQAGITYSWRQGEEFARAGGVVYVGDKPHIFELSGEMPLKDFLLFQRSLMNQIQGGSQTSLPTSGR